MYFIFFNVNSYKLGSHTVVENFLFQEGLPYHHTGIVCQ